MCVCLLLKVVLQCEEPLVVYGHSEKSEQMTPEVYRSTDSVKTFCCIPRGDVSIKARYSSNTFEPSCVVFTMIAQTPFIVTRQMHTASRGEPENACMQFVWSRGKHTIKKCTQQLCVEMW